MTLVRWNPARELASMEIDRLNHMLNDFYGVGRAWMPAVDIFETNDHEYVLKADSPSVNLTPHLNHQIEVTGKVASPSAGATPSGTTGATGAGAAGANRPVLTVTEVKMIAAECKM